jgi:hypothetical protein
LQGENGVVGRSLSEGDLNSRRDILFHAPAKFPTLLVNLHASLRRSKPSSHFISSSSPIAGSVISMIKGTLLDSLALFALSIAASAAFLSRMRQREPVKDDDHNSGD